MAPPFDAPTTHVQRLLPFAKDGRPAGFAPSASTPSNSSAASSLFKEGHQTCVISMRSYLAMVEFKGLTSRFL